MGSPVASAIYGAPRHPLPAYDPIRWHTPCHGDHVGSCPRRPFPFGLGLRWFGDWRHDESHAVVVIVIREFRSSITVHIVPGLFPALPPIAAACRRCQGEWL